MIQDFNSLFDMMEVWQRDGASLHRSLNRDPDWQADGMRFVRTVARIGSTTSRINALTISRTTAES